MDPIVLIVAAGAYVAAEVAKKCADLTIEKAFNRVVSLFKARLGRSPGPEDFDANAVRAAKLDQDPALEEQVNRVVAGSPALRRARLIAPVLAGARILWVDDIPANNVYEQRVLGAFDVQIDLALTTEEAMEKIGRGRYDLIVSDMARQGRADAGLQLVRYLRAGRHQIPVVFYVGRVDPSRGTPPDSFAITDRPEPLFHYTFDVLERQRV